MSTATDNNNDQGIFWEGLQTSTEKKEAQRQELNLNDQTDNQK